MKRIELGLLQRTKTLSTVLDAQILYLEEWSALEEDYSVSLSEAIQALLNASLQLPIGNVRADIREVGEALNSATNMMEMIVFHLQSFVPNVKQAEETENLISELARVTGGEKALIGECGGLLSKTYASQVEEFSLRGQLIQLHHCSHKDNLVKTE
ncbi:protein ENDOSPERM DEFECTIVE 1-like isoform X2 [Quercus robur]|nr:protein ENDOSPERM DEFECTIVE 1-like isoform X2 [Quercus robur]